MNSLALILTAALSSPEFLAAQSPESAITPTAIQTEPGEDTPALSVNSQERPSLRPPEFASLRKALDAVSVLADKDLRLVTSPPAQAYLALALAEVEQQVQTALSPALEAAATGAGAQVEAAQRQVKRQLARAQQTLQLAQVAPTAAAGAAASTAPVPLGQPYRQRLANVVSRGHGSSGRTLVIRSSDTDPKSQAHLEEDLAVMSRIFDKALEEKLSDDHRHRVMGIDVFIPLGSNPIRGLYLEGYGALFLMSVNFPLLPPPEKPEVTREKSDVDSAWEEAKREINGRPGALAQLDRTFKFGTDSGPEQEYDERKVEDVRESLLASLKNATNIRTLKSDEAITVCVLGGASAAPRKARMEVKRAPGAADEDADTVVAWSRDDAVPARGTILTIRVKKSDVDAFAKGRMDLDEFRKKAAITTYAGDSSGWGGGGAFGLWAP